MEAVEACSPPLFIAADVVTMETKHLIPNLSQLQEPKFSLWFVTFRDKSRLQCEIWSVWYAWFSCDASPRRIIIFRDYDGPVFLSESVIHVCERLVARWIHEMGIHQTICIQNEKILEEISLTLLQLQWHVALETIFLFVILENDYASFTINN